MEQLLYEVAGRKYLLVEVPIVKSNSKKVEEALKKYECINQGVKEVKQPGFWNDGFVITRVLVPEENAKAFGDVI